MTALWLLVPVVGAAVVIGLVRGDGTTTVRADGGGADDPLSRLRRGLTGELPVPATTAAGKPANLLVRIFTTVDHKDIGLLYLGFAFWAGIWGGTDAMMMRTELVTPRATVWDVGTYNELFTMHALTMLFFFVTPAFTGLGNYFLPLLIGADDMAYPRVNAIGFWLLPPALLLARGGLLTEVVGKLLSAIGVVYPPFGEVTPPAISWTMYVPLSAQSPNPQVSILLLALHLSGIATVLAAINFIVTVFTERADDVTWANLDIFSWSMLTTSGLILFAFPLLGSALVMLLLDRTFGTHFFTFEGGPILWQHLFWFFGHPEVYILVLPAFGLTSLILPKFAGRHLFGYRFIVYSTLAIGVLSFGVWAHHMFATGIDPRVRASFMAISLAIAVPSAIKTFNWITTLWNGRIRLEAPLLFLVGSIALFIVGGITGVFLAAIPVDLIYHGTYYIVGHFHLIIMGIIPFSIFAAAHYWYPLLTGRWYDRRLATVSAILIVVGSATAFTAILIIGTSGLPRRIAEYPSGFATLQQVATAGAYAIFAGTNVWLYNMVQSFRIGDRVQDGDPWNLKETGQFTREWAWFERRLEEREE